MNKEILFTEDAIKKRVKELGKEIERDYEDGFVAISLLRGSFIFAADLLRNIDRKVEIDFLTTSSYENEEKSCGDVKFLSNLRSDIENRDVLIIDDILDTGNTLKSVKEKLIEMNPKSLKSAVLLNKPSRREVEVESEYIGFTIDDLFIVGYGLNYGDYYRNVPYIYSYVED